MSAVLKTFPDRDLLCTVEDIALVKNGKTITHCGAKLYGRYFPGGGSDKAIVEPRKVTLMFPGEEVEVENPDIEDLLIQDYLDNE